MTIKKVVLVASLLFCYVMVWLIVDVNVLAVKAKIFLWIGISTIGIASYFIGRHNSFDEDSYPRTFDDLPSGTGINFFLERVFADGYAFITMANDCIGNAPKLISEIPDELMKREGCFFAKPRKGGDGPQFTILSFD